MNENDSKENNTIAKGILAANVSILGGFLFVFQAAYSSIVSKSAVLIALTLLIISLVLILWHLYRTPIRKKLWDKYVHEVASRGAERIDSYTKGIVLPLTRYNIQEKLAEKPFKSKKEYDEYHQKYLNVMGGKAENDENITGMPKVQEEAEKVVRGALAEQILNETQEAHNKAFHMPLKEKHGKIKYKIDKFASKAKYNFFTSGCIFLGVSFYIEIILR